MKVAVLKETFPGEKRVALAPGNVAQLTKAGLEVQIEKGAGVSAGFLDAQYVEKGAHIAETRADALRADLILQVRTATADSDHGGDGFGDYRSGQTVIGMCDPLGSPETATRAAEAKVDLFSLELIPRITRAQSMDVLSSQATIAGYRAVVLAAYELPKLFPMMMTAAGTLKAARAFVVGAGVAGLQAIATAKRLGAVVQAYDVRPDTREQVESVGGRFVALELEAGDAEDKGGYAKEMGEEFLRKQRELMARIVAESDIVITTAAIPGKRSPLLITNAAVEGMAPGSVIVDLAAERGGNCEPSQPDQRVVHQGVVVLGPTNLAADVAQHASQMFSNNVTKLLLNMVDSGRLILDFNDEIIRGTLIACDGVVRSERIRSLLNLEPLPPVEEPAPTPAASEAEADPPKLKINVTDEPDEAEGDPKSD
ncbi:MAG: Re/Si-specific NAD(P)(+) transhydrogenase subunit alpha [bacterium]|nr:Re/Si-specific NAD(P)(+) transhydrogenase subunit alpha [bacterium]